jgi:hypothetical protein
MSLAVQCGNCRTRLRLPDSAAGKVFKCPKCGTKSAAPATPATEPAVLEVRQEAAAVSSPPKEKGPAPKRPKKRRRKRRPLKWLFEPVLHLGGLALTPAVLGILIVSLAGLSWFVYSRNLFGASKASVSVVQVFGVRNHVPLFDSPRMNDAQKAMAVKLQSKFILVTAPDPQGAHLLVKFTLTKKILEEAFGNKMMAAHIETDDVVLQAGDKKLHPAMFLLDELKDRGLLLHYPPPTMKEAFPGDKAGPAGKVANIEPLRHSSFLTLWGRYDGLNAQPDGSWQFRSPGGMAVDCKITESPDYTIQLTWDKQSQGWLGDPKWADSPMQLTWDWDVTCFFHKPPSTDDMKLQVLGHPISVRWQ